MDTHSPNQAIEHDPGQTAARVIESAVRLARAEATLVLGRVHVLLVGAISVWAAIMLAASAAQVALLLIALGPALGESLGSILVAVIPSVALSALGWCLALRAWRKLRSDSGSVSQQGPS